MDPPGPSKKVHSFFVVVQAALNEMTSLMAEPTFIYASVRPNLGNRTGPRSGFWGLGKMRGLGLPEWG